MRAENMAQRRHRGSVRQRKRRLKINSAASGVKYRRREASVVRRATSAAGSNGGSGGA